MGKKIIVIGLGSMGKRRIRLLRELDGSNEITGVDSRANRRDEMAEKYGVKCVADLSEIVESMDCAFVCTPPQTHGEIIRECLERGWHVFSEINLIANLYDENIRLAKEKGKVLFLSSTPIYRAEMRFITERVRQIGKPCVYQYHVGQYLPDWHPWDNLKDFFVSSRATNGCREFLAIELPWMQRAFGRITNMSVVKKELTSLNLGFPDTYLIQAEHEGGCVGNLLIDIVSRQAVRCLEVMNEKLYIKWNGTPESLYEKDIITGELKQMQIGEYVHEQGYADNINEVSYLEEINEFFDVIGGKKPVYGFEEDREILKCIDKIES